MKKIPLLIALLAVWFVGSSYWYTCRIEYACTTKGVTASTNNGGTDSGKNDTKKYGKIETIYFLPDSAELLNEKGSQSTLDELATYAKNNTSVDITIKGYTANIANGVDDDALSKSRADEIRQRLQALGVNNSIAVVQKGVADQIGNTQDEANLAKNRRATIEFNQ